MEIIKIDGEYLDLQPGSSILRERNSPYFLTTTSDGKDGIPGEVSYPFTIPITEKNSRLLGFPTMIPTQSPRSFDVTVVDASGYENAAKLVMTENQVQLNHSGLSLQECFLLQNSSAFFKLVQDKKLTELSLGGERTFTWNGYSRHAVGFWKHVHDTWDYTSADDGDYVFYPVKNSGYLGFATVMNRPFLTSTQQLEMHRENVTSLCPHIFLKYIIEQIFIEHGYTVSGDILNDADFKQLTLLSLMGVYWSRINLPTVRDGLEYLAPDPFSSITISLGEHMPPKNTIAEFMVSLCKFLPLGFEINDLSRHCEIVLLKPVLVSSETRSLEKVAAVVKRSFSPADEKIWGIKRIFTNDGLPYLDYNLYGGRGARDSTSSYTPDGATDFIENDMTPLALDKGSFGSGRTVASLNWLKTESGTLVLNPYYVPVMEVEGNWYDKEEITDWGFRVMFYKGRDFPLETDNTLLAPYATHQPNRWRYQPGFTSISETKTGNWALTFENVDFGMIDYWWREYLELLSRDELLKARLFFDQLDYYSVQWRQLLQFQHVNYILKKMTDLLPYPGYVDVEALRLPG